MRHYWVRTVEGFLEAAVRLRTRLVKSRMLLGIAVVGLIVGTVWSIATVEIEMEGLSPLPLFLVGIVGVPITVVTNAAEFAYSARLVGTAWKVRDSIPVALASSAANYLPFPGGTAVRVAALGEIGHSARAAFGATAAVALAWVAVGGLSIAVAVCKASALLSGVSAIGGLVAGFGFLLLARSIRSGETTASCQILGVESVSVLVSGLRLFLVMAGLGLSVSYPAALAIAGSGIVASIVAFSPGGLGIREIGAAAIAGLVGVDPAVAFLAAVIDRVIGGLVTAPWASLTVLKRRGLIGE